MKTAFLLFFILLFLSTYAKAQQTFNSIKIKDLELPSETASKVLYLDGDKKVQSSTIGTAELEYLSGTTSAIQDQLDTNATAISTHEADVTVHGTTGDVVGTSDSQTLTNKTISGASIQSPTRLDPKKDTLANLTSYAATASNGELVYSTDTKEFYTVTDGALVAAGGGGLEAKGQGEGSSIVTTTLEAPNNQLTTTATDTRLLETGNANILKDPSLEGANNSSAWVFSGGVLTIDNTPIHGLINGQIDTTATSLSMTQSSTLYQAQFADGVQGLASMRVRVPSSITTPIYVCSIQNGVEGSTSSGCVQVQANGKWGLYKVPFILGATSNGIALTSKGVSYTGTIEWDDAFVGAVDLKQDVDQSRIAGESYFAGTAACEWVRTSTTIGAFSVDADCPGPTIVTTSMGAWATTDSNLPRQTVDNLPAGTYKASFYVLNFPSASVYSAFSINDGTTTCEAVGGNGVATASVGVVVSCTFKYTSSGTRVFELYGASSSGTVSIYGSTTTPRASTKFQLEYFGSGSVYSATNADTDWASCGHTTSSFTGFGTVSAIETQCKRQGGDLLMKGKFTSGTSTAVEARIGLALNGVALTSKSSGTIPSIQLAGNATRGVADATQYMTLIEPSVAYITIGGQSTGGAGLLKLNGSSILASGNTFSFNARIPINGWENSNIIIGSFNEVITSKGITKPSFVSAEVSSAGVVSQDDSDFINGNCAVTDTSLYTCTWNTSYWASAPKCIPNTTSTNNGLKVDKEAIPTTTSGIFRGANSTSGAKTSSGFTLMCHGSVP